MQDRKRFANRCAHAGQTGSLDASSGQPIRCKAQSLLPSGSRK